MDSSEQISRFDLAVRAFEIRFNRELKSCWERIEELTIPSLTAATTEAKRGGLSKCFANAAEEIASAVHGYFPRLLEIATEAPESLRVGDLAETTSGIAFWTSHHIREQVCRFLEMDTHPEDNVTPSDDSVVARSTRRMLSLAGCLSRNSNDELLLPRWADTSLSSQLSRLFIRDGPLGVGKNPDPDGSLSEYDNECMTRAETVEWIATREREITERLEAQLNNEWLDAMATAGTARGSRVSNQGVETVEKVRCSTEMIRDVAPGVGQFSPVLTDLHKPIPTTIKEITRQMRGELDKLGAPSRRLKYDKMGQAVDYKRAHPKETYAEVSRKFFGETKQKDTIRSRSRSRNRSRNKNQPSLLILRLSRRRLRLLVLPIVEPQQPRFHS